MANDIAAEPYRPVHQAAQALNRQHDYSYSEYSATRRDDSVTTVDVPSSDRVQHDNVDASHKQHMLQPRPRGRSMLDEIAAHAGHGEEQPPASSRPKCSSLRQSRRERQPTHHTIHEAPILEQIQSPDLELYHSYMNSTSTGSGQFEVVHSPADSWNGFASPPLAVSSPVEMPDLSTSWKSAPDARSFMPHSAGSLRRKTRRSTARTASASASPAEAFLAHFSPDYFALPAEPDEEGQEIGDSGEYIIGRQIGFGGFSVVKEAFAIEDNERIRRAVKIVRKQITGKSEQQNEEMQNDFEHEVSIWRCLKHPYILPLVAVFDSPFATFCITKLSSGGTLFELVRRQRRSRPSDVSLVTSAPKIPKKLLPFGHVKRYIYQIASALRYLHQDMRIVHRDVKLENCLVDTEVPLSASVSTASLSASGTSIASMASEFTDENISKALSWPGNILLCDFGMADFITRDDREVFLPSTPHTKEQNGSETDEPNNNSRPNIGPGPNSASLSTSVNITGSLPYAAPELMTASEPLYSTSTDIWSFGVLCYALLTGDLPFTHGLAAKVESQISSGEWDASHLHNSVRSAAMSEQIEEYNETQEADNALALIKGCLDLDPRTRWDATKILECEFLENGAELYERED